MGTCLGHAWDAVGEEVGFERVTDMLCLFLISGVETQHSVLNPTYLSKIESYLKIQDSRLIVDAVRRDGEAIYNLKSESTILALKKVVFMVFLRVLSVYMYQ